MNLSIPRGIVKVSKYPLFHGQYSERGEGENAWVGSRTNILKVAVKRAKQRLYIVGYKDKWTKGRYFKIAYDICDR